MWAHVSLSKSMFKPGTHSDNHTGRNSVKSWLISLTLKHMHVHLLSDGGRCVNGMRAAVDLPLYVCTCVCVSSRQRAMRCRWVPAELSNKTFAWRCNYLRGLNTFHLTTLLSAWQAYSKLVRFTLCVCVCVCVCVCTTFAKILRECIWQVLLCVYSFET